MQSREPPKSQGADALLPSILQYIDRDLLRNAAEHNHPPTLDTTCGRCKHPHNPQTVNSIFLRLTCGCWMHYICFIIGTGQIKNRKRNRCWVCSTPLFEWEGIAVLTILTRTGFEMPNQSFSKENYYVNSYTNTLVTDTKTEQQLDCNLIEQYIHFHYKEQLDFASPFADKSPDLVACSRRVITSVVEWKIPTCEWLKFKTKMEFLLFSTLVLHKVRRILAEHYPDIVRTEAWGKLKEGIERFKEISLEKWKNASVVEDSNGMVGYTVMEEVREQGGRAL